LDEGSKRRDALDSPALRCSLLLAGSCASLSAQATGVAPPGSGPLPGAAFHTCPNVRLVGLSMVCLDGTRGGHNETNRVAAGSRRSRRIRSGSRIKSCGLCYVRPRCTRLLQGLFELPGLWGLVHLVGQDVPQGRWLCMSGLKWLFGQRALSREARAINAMRGANRHHICYLYIGALLPFWWPCFSPRVVRKTVGRGGITQIKLTYVSPGRWGPSNLLTLVEMRRSAWYARTKAEATTSAAKTVEMIRRLVFASVRRLLTEAA
jgi:hypothetical protein